MSKLKDCPFCGSNNVHTIQGILDDGEFDTHTFSVVCLDCKTGIFRPNLSDGEMSAYTNAKDAERAWNKRPDKVG